MNFDSLPFAFNCIIGLVITLSLGLTGFLLYSEKLLKPRAGRSGEWVSEVWLEWEICRGSTMYRQRFSYRWTAYLATRLHALLLDMVLPSHYWNTDCIGRRCLYRHEYGILYGVRKVLPSEALEFSPVWSDVLPGHRGHSGEHACSHPFERWNGELQGSTVDYLL